MKWLILAIILFAVAWYATRKDQWTEYPYGDHPVIDNELDWLS